MVLEAALNRLTDPQRAVRRELEPATPVELLDRADQAEHSLLDQVLHRQAVTLIAPGLRDDEPEVRVDHPLLGGKVTALDPLGELGLLSRGQQRVDAGLTHEQLERLERACAPIGVVVRTSTGLGAGMRTPPAGLPSIRGSRPTLGRARAEAPGGFVFAGPGGSVRSSSKFSNAIPLSSIVRYRSNYSIVRRSSNDLFEVFRRRRICG